MQPPGKVPKLLTIAQQSVGLVYRSLPTFALEGELGFFTFKNFEYHLAHDGEVQGRDVVSCPATTLVERYVQWPGQIVFDPTRGRSDRGGTDGHGRHLRGRRDGGPLDRPNVRKLADRLDRVAFLIKGARPDESVPLPSR
jgi:hypothetical protein